jgi:hypothetical protein
MFVIVSSHSDGGNGFADDFEKKRDHYPAQTAIKVIPFFSAYRSYLFRVAGSFPPDFCTVLRKYSRREEIFFSSSSAFPSKFSRSILVTSDRRNDATVIELRREEKPRLHQRRLHPGAASYNRYEVSDARSRRRSSKAGLNPDAQDVMRTIETERSDGTIGTTGTL